MIYSIEEYKKLKMKRTEETSNFKDSITAFTPSDTVLSSYKSGKKALLDVCAPFKALPTKDQILALLSIYKECWNCINNKTNFLDLSEEEKDVFLIAAANRLFMLSTDITIISMTSTPLVNKAREVFLLDNYEDYDNYVELLNNVIDEATQRVVESNYVDLDSYMMILEFPI